MENVDRDTGERHGAIRFLACGDSPVEARERNRSFAGVLFAHIMLISALAFTPAPDFVPLPATTTLALILESGDQIQELEGAFTLAAGGSVVGEPEAPKPKQNSTPARSRIKLAGVPIPPSLPTPPSIPIPAAPAFVQPAPDVAYVRGLIEHALEAGNGADHERLGREDVTGGERSLQQLMEGPTATPYTRAPALLNPGEIQSFLLRKYPSSLQSAGLGGRAVLWLLIDDRGEVLKATLHTTSGYQQLDKAALEAVPRMEFSPGWNNGRKVPVWVQQPINFRAY